MTWRTQVRLDLDLKKKHNSLAGSYTQFSVGSIHRLMKRSLNPSWGICKYLLWLRKSFGPEGVRQIRMFGVANTQGYDFGAWLLYIGFLVNRAAPALAQLPSACREALTHTALVCTGTPPTYYPPGWGPCSLCWGWFLLGCCCGMIACVALLTPWYVAQTRERRLPHPPHNTPTWWLAAQELLASVAEGGLHELRHVATASGNTPEELLCLLLREATASAPPPPSVVETTATPRTPLPPSSSQTSQLRRRRLRPTWQ